MGLIWYNLVPLRALPLPVWHAAYASVEMHVSGSLGFPAGSGELCLAGKHPSGSPNRPCDGDAFWDAAGAGVWRLQGVAGGACAHAPGQLAQVSHAQRGLSVPSILPPSTAPRWLQKRMYRCDHADAHMRLTSACHN